MILHLPQAVPRFVLARPLLAHDVDEAMSTVSGRSLSLGKERDWWRADLEDEMENLEVEGCFSVTEGGSTDLERKADH